MFSVSTCTIVITISGITATNCGKTAKIDSSNGGKSDDTKAGNVSTKAVTRLVADSTRVGSKALNNAGKCSDSNGAA